MIQGKKKVISGAYLTLSLIALFVEPKVVNGEVLIYYAVVLLNLIIATLTVNRTFSNGNTSPRNRNRVHERFN